MYRFLFLCLIFPLILCRCTSDQSRPDPETNTSSSTAVSDPTILSGKNLAKKHCQSCHLFPAPDLLDKATWAEHVLPNMGARLGIKYNDYDPFDGVEPEEIATIKKLNIYPEQAVLKKEEWMRILKYYEALAPEQLPGQNRPSPVSESPPPFTPNLIEIGDRPVPQVTLLEYDQHSGTLFIGDHLNLYGLNQEGAIVGNWQTQSPSTDISTTDQGIFLLSIGQFNPSEKREGVFFPLSLNSKRDAEDFVITELPRPVQFAIGDLNEDQEEDLVICGFGNHQGQLGWYDNFQKEKFHLLTNLPGSRKVVIKDLNGDGRNDIIALMAQAWEKIVVFYNAGNGNFEEKTLVEFPAIYGSSYFELVDFNQDGYLDILLTNGDNWDYSSIKKPYHGLRIYMNNGSNQFASSYFYPMYGCNEARAIDFDLDGDLDIAAIAFYDDEVKKPDERFVYLENDGQLNFTAHYMNETSCGKWLTMDTGDFNDDGYPDIFLGSYFHNFNELSKMMLQGVETFPEVLLLTYEE